MDYERLLDPGDGLRLHLNENTAGCSQRVIEAIRAIPPSKIAVYPDYSAVTTECAAALGVPPDRIALTNGLDEGIWAAAGGCTSTSATTSGEIFRHSSSPARPSPVNTKSPMRHAWTLRSLTTS
jgi:histidinol-phosphate/aromatic aminotransferase/cobyric acid decarboxylase-like protein